MCACACVHVRACVSRCVRNIALIFHVGHFPPRGQVCLTEKKGAASRERLLLLFQDYFSPRKRCRDVIKTLPLAPSGSAWRCCCLSICTLLLSTFTRTFSMCRGISSLSRLAAGLHIQVATGNVVLLYCIVLMDVCLKRHKNLLFSPCEPHDNNSIEQQQQPQQQHHHHPHQ